MEPVTFSHVVRCNDDGLYGILEMEDRFSGGPLSVFIDPEILPRLIAELRKLEEDLEWSAATGQLAPALSGGGS
jgi:hypothetical protein